MLMVQAKVNPFVAFCLCLLLGVLCGFVIGILILGLLFNALVATIGMTGIYSGINLVATQGRAITGIPQSILFLGKGDIAGIPVPFIFLIAMAIVVTLLALCTPFGRYIYAIGNNREPAQMLGIKEPGARHLFHDRSFIFPGRMLMVARLSPNPRRKYLRWFRRRAGHRRGGDQRRRRQPARRTHRRSDHRSHRKCYRSLRRLSLLADDCQRRHCGAGNLL